jgi:hypothetical protein
MKTTLRTCVLSLLWLTALGAQVVPYDIVYVRQPRFGDNTNTTWPEVFHPARIDPGADLMLLHPDGSEEVLVAGGNGAVTDPFLSFDAQWCYYAQLPDTRPAAVNDQRGDLPYAGSDIYRMHLATRVVQRLTHQEWSPNTAAGHWHPTNPVNPPSSFNRLGYGILNLGPCPLPGGKIVFTSNRHGFLPTKPFTNPCLQLFVMDEDGEHVTPIAPMSFGNYERQGLRDERLWGIRAIWPDGRKWSPTCRAMGPRPPCVSPDRPMPSPCAASPAARLASATAKGVAEVSEIRSTNCRPSRCTLCQH